MKALKKDTRRTVKTNVQTTSLDAYFTEIVPTLGRRQREIVDVYIENPSMDFTNAELSEELDRPINTVTPRVYELMGKDKSHPKFQESPVLIVSRIRECKATGRRARATQINPDWHDKL